jgi:hypothetical protein
MFGNFPALVFLIAGPALAAVGLRAVGAVAETLREPTIWWLLAESLADDILWCSACVSWHRFVLLGERDKASWLAIPFGPRQGRFFLYLLLFSVPGMLGSMLLWAFGPAALGVAAPLPFIALILWFCFPLVFPAVALDRSDGLASAWRTLRGSALTLFFAGLLASLPLVALVLLLLVVGDALGVVAEAIAAGPLMIVSIGVGVTLLSLAYAQLSDLTGALARMDGPD